jgi:hypothetical protein
MINLTTDEMEHYGTMIIDMVSKNKRFEKFNVAELVSLFSSAIYIVGRRVGESTAIRLNEYEEEEIDTAG